jgi:acetoin:2,6-dichlorophenolindophenol oxidoreductase subunit beta
VPSSPGDAKGLLTSAIFDEDPCIFVETIRLQGQRGPVPLDPGFAVPLGQAEVKRPGSDITLIGYGRGLVEALRAADQLEADGIQAEVLDLRTLVPLDVQTMVDSVRRTRHAVVVHDAVRFAGPGAEITAILQEQLFGELAAPVARLGARFVPNPAARNLESEVYPNADRIAEAARATLKQGGNS